MIYFAENLFASR